MPTPSVFHQKISIKLSREMSFFTEDNDLGEVLTAPMDTKFDENNNVCKQIFYSLQLPDMTL